MQLSHIFITNTPEDPIQNTVTFEGGRCILSQLRKAQPAGTKMETSRPLPQPGVRKQVGQTWEHWCSFIGQTDAGHPTSALTSHCTVRAH